jgi:hypothetical protein
MSQRDYRILKSTSCIGCPHGTHFLENDTPMNLWDSWWKAPFLLKVTLGIWGAVILLSGVAGYLFMHEAKKWDEFVKSHDCRIVERIEGTSQLVTGFSSDGNTTIMNITPPSKTAYKCNDGVIYWR